MSETKSTPRNFFKVKKISKIKRLKRKETSTELHPSVIKQISYTRYLAHNHRKSANILEGIADTAARLNFMTPSMKRVITINSDAVKFAITATSGEEK
jgi:hypothetical protein